MAEQQRLAAYEKTIITARLAANALTDSARVECATGGVPENYDHWGTVLTNLELLLPCVTQAIAAARKAKEAASRGGT
jgi:hypothetical protein